MALKKIVSRDEWFDDLASRIGQPAYYSMYSSLQDAIITDPACMLLPIDDHVVHRGDGVFETLKLYKGAVYNLNAHLRRLEHSASAIDLTVPVSLDEIADIIKQCCAAAIEETACIRLMLSRGPGSFGVNPWDTIGTQLYVVVYKSPLPFMKHTPRGAKIMWSKIPVKATPLAQSKSCNYLPNALMRREAEQAGMDYSIMIDPNGMVAEGATENISILTEELELLRCPNDYILEGTTTKRVFELAETLVKSGKIKQVSQRAISKTEVAEAKEVYVMSTTCHVCSVVELEGRPIGEGIPGPLAKELDRLLSADMETNSNLRFSVRKK